MSFEHLSKCSECPFGSRAQVPSWGDPATCKYVLVGEAPGRHEIVKKRPFVGDTGTLLEAFLRQIRLDLNGGDFYLMNAMSCGVRDKRKVKNAVRSCRQRVLAELRSINPDATIVLMGLNARESLYPGEQGGVLASRGWREWEGRDIFISAHPSYFLYNPDQAPMMVKDLNRVKRGRQPQIGPFEVIFKHEEKTVGEFGYTAEIISTQDQLQGLIEGLKSVPLERRNFLAFDLETDQVDFQRDRILCMSISTKIGRAYIIPDSLLYRDGSTFYTGDWSKYKFEDFLEDERYRTGSYLKPNPQTVALLNELFELGGYRWTGHNAKFDLRFLIGQLGVTSARCDFDTIDAHYVLDERSGGHGLKPLADDYFDVGDYEHDLFNYIDKKSARYSKVPRKVLYKYNAMDTECTLRLAIDLERELKEQGLYEWPFRRLLTPASEMLLYTELSGVYVDWAEVDRIDREELQPEIRKLRDHLREISGHPELNPLSSIRVNNLLYDELKFPIVSARTRAGGHHVTGRSSQKAIVDAWEKMHQQGKLPVSNRAWEFVETLQEFRHLRKLQGSYIRKWKRYRGTDDRVHTSYLIRGTVTGRLSATDPPMQTIPSKITDRWGPMVANIHKPQPGWKLMYADYSQAELMVLAGLSKDPLMLSTFMGGADYHSIVAEAAYGPDFTRDQRQASKKLTFGWAYGGDVKEIALDALQFDGPVANRFAGEWDRMFAGAVKWRKEQGDKMVEQGYVESIYGRRRRQLLLTRETVGKARRIAINSPIQSAVSDFTLISAIRLYQRFRGTDYARVVLLIHDSLIMEVREDKVEEVAKTMHEIMLEVPRKHFPEIPFQAEIKVGDQLGDLT